MASLVSQQRRVRRRLVICEYVHTASEPRACVLGYIFCQCVCIRSRAVLPDQTTRELILVFCFWPVSSVIEHLQKPLLELFSLPSPNFFHTTILTLGVCIFPARDIWTSFHAPSCCSARKRLRGWRSNPTMAWPRRSGRAVLTTTLAPLPWQGQISRTSQWRTGG